MEAILAGSSSNGTQLDERRDKALEIHPSSIVSSRARIGGGVRIGPWCTVGPDVEIGDNVELISHVVIDGHTTLGEGVVCYPFTTVGMAPQDLKYRGEPTACVVGARTIIRENVTIHRGTATGTGITCIGPDCLIMANSHVAHDCTLGRGVIIVNNVVMGGHVTIGDDARIMGAAALHQFVRIGRAALVGGVCGVEADVIPYGSVLGNRARLVGLHWIWLRRNGVQPDEIRRMRQAFRALYPKAAHATGTVFQTRLEHVRNTYADDARVVEILDFIAAPSHRGLVRVQGGDMIESDGA
ncbi:acyl-[acyl-carrier-protein]--UDP-N-acetylglucosamine O-acyltransferase [Komagataeibacter xylinus]|uniref:Acyl-[acyl-carrier-protein]--UDP-N-acetylglucosamine O-acyltransferase n=1 Tax=Komagataeibacter xylinus TaxID=28448 RepID=A0A318PQ48_KOMXY|nr:acyl-ACP--UDP-N-acetylglucosamine O-acyltransferase [Komagataeibacter xylinus]AZV39667.1 acyl-ACP--UDP-N-acetylglucosamine O-acyltransferase [Komagataeibacter xylinus]PYD58475.1 acyl-[acyl-carrier-protein]--UDP-N-acetylglucosamine O-acyltransferase [Komagataeibacter xylinus]GBQ68393.1 UDP-N-acetylglucosamine acyltransferase [Komagataeibacter xylinus NBRC 15237]